MALPAFTFLIFATDNDSRRKMVMRTKRRFLSSICLLTAVMMLVCGCAQNGKASEPLRAATQGGNSDSLISFDFPVTSGEEIDINALKTILNYGQMREVPSEKDNKIDATIEGKSFSVTYSSTNLFAYKIPSETDFYSGKDENGKVVDVFFPRGNTSKVIGYSLDFFDKYDDTMVEIEKLSEKELVELARKAAAKYTDIRYYNDYSIEYTSSAYEHGYGWYEVVFYATISGIRAADYAYVRIFPDGQVWWVMTPPTTGIAKKVSSRLDAAACDAMADEQITAMYCNSDSQLEYVSRELYRRLLTVDDEGNPVVVYKYKVIMHDPSPAVRDDGITLPERVVDFATVAVWVG